MAKIIGWVARSKQDNALWFYKVKPRRTVAIGEGMWIPDSVKKYAGAFDLGKCPLFKTLKWEDEPVKVELTIRKI